MKYMHRFQTTLHRIQTFPIFLLNLSISQRLLIVLFSYALSVPALWFLFPYLNNAASMLLPMVCLCWFFRYRGLIISMATTFMTIWLVHTYFLNNMPINSTVIERALIGIALALLLSLTICWLRTTIDLMQAAHEKILATEQKRLQALENERKITTAYEQQRKINEIKDQFLLNVSHELRIPLTILGSYLELLEIHREHLTETEQARVQKEILKSHKDLVNVVNRVLDATTVMSEIPQARVEVIHVYQFLQELLTHLSQSDAQAYTIHLQVSDDITVLADPQFLHQILQNLLSNVFKYVPRQTRICIEGTQDTPLSPVHLSVQDAGPGIPTEEIPLLFEKFVRLKRDLAGTTRGTGLGLYICRRLVEAMHGSIWVESSGRPGEGCRFCLTLPPPSPS